MKGFFILLFGLHFAIVNCADAQIYEDQFSTSEERNAYLQKVLAIAKRSTCWGNKHIDSIIKVYILELDSTFSKNDTIAADILKHAKRCNCLRGDVAQFAYLVVGDRIEGLVDAPIMYCYTEQLRVEHEALSNAVKMLDVDFMFRISMGNLQIIAVTKYGELYVLHRSFKFLYFTPIRLSEYTKTIWPLFNRI